jgi:hypothetical protein
MNYRLLTISICVIGLAAQNLPTADAQQNSAPSRRTVKVKPRLFNPFDVSRSQLTVDPFGIVRFQSKPLPIPESMLPSWAAATGISAILGPVAPVGASASAAVVANARLVDAVSSVPASRAATASAPSAGGAGGEVLASGAAVRPPFRPPVRSPFRPPPRPPF